MQINIEFHNANKYRIYHEVECIQESNSLFY